MTLIAPAMFIAANAQIVYTDVTPDSTLDAQTPSGFYSENYDLDLNNDTNNDFIIRGGSFVWGSPQCVGNASITPGINTAADIAGKIIYSTSAIAPDSYRQQKLEVNTKDFTYLDDTGRGSIYFL